MKTIAVINKSTLVNDTDGALMVKACLQQLHNDVAPLLGRDPWSVKYYAKGKVAPAAYFPIVLLDDPDQANALGYHTEDPDGKVWGRVFAKPVLSNGGSALRGSMSVSSVLSHEVIETFADPSVNYWVDRYDGTFVAYEMCDPVESDTYDIKVSPGLLKASVPVSVSNFVTDAWFDPQAAKTAQLDFMHTTTAPLKLSRGGYVVILNVKTGKVTEVFGSHNAEALHKIKKPGFPAARTSKRSNHQ